MLPQLEITRITDGLGIGHGSISAESVERAPENSDLAEITDQAIADRVRILVPIDVDEATGQPVDDDGCGDGRGAKTIFSGAGSTLRTFRRSLHRAKVFGGGLMMAAATRIGLGKASGDLFGTVADAKEALADKGVNYGAHTDDHDHAHDENCGCGAIDKAPLIVQAVAENQEHIVNVVGMLGINTGALEGSHGVLTNFATAAQQNNETYSGKKVMQAVAEDRRITKQLEGPHRETRIILNLVEGYTVDQGFVREATDGRAQLFAVDVWRLKQIAKKLYGDPQHPEIETPEEHGAFLSELAYTLGTAIVLTDGTLPVYVVQRAEYALGA